jgi:hypothetical protein
LPPLCRLGWRLDRGGRTNLRRICFRTASKVWWRRSRVKNGIETDANNGWSALNSPVRRYQEAHFWQVLMMRSTVASTLFSPRHCRHSVRYSRSCPSPPVWFMPTPQKTESHQYSDQNSCTGTPRLRLPHPSTHPLLSCHPFTTVRKNCALQLRKHSPGSSCQLPFFISAVLM